MKNILLTGATGFLGKVIVEELVEQFPVSSIYCLTRSKGELSAKERIQSIIKAENVNALEGDITEDKLGLSEMDYKFCVENIDTIVHSAASTKFNAPMDFLEKHNINATNEMIALANEIAVATEVKPFFVYVSTAYQAGKSNFCVEEKFFLKPVLGFKNNYERSKWLTEQLIQQQLETCQFTIVRPSIIMAYESGKCSADGVGIGVFGLLNKKSRIFPSPVPVTKELLLDFVTVDYVAGSIVDIIAVKDTIPNGTIFHLTDVNGGMSGKAGIPISNKAFGIKLFGVNVNIVKYILNVLMKFTNLVSARDKRVLDAYLDYFGTNPTFETKNLSLFL